MVIFTTCQHCGELVRLYRKPKFFFKHCSISQKLIEGKYMETQIGFYTRIRKEDGKFFMLTYKSRRHPDVGKIVKETLICDGDMEAESSTYNLDVFEQKPQINETLVEVPNEAYTKDSPTMISSDRVNFKQVI